MTTPDIRALCAELIEKIDYTWGDVPEDVLDLMDRARAALAAEPVGDCDDPLVPARYIGNDAAVYRNGFHSGYKHAITRMTQPTTPPAPEPGEVAELVRRLRDWHSIPLLQERERAATLLEDLGQFNLNGIQWIIVGGESGPGARPMKAEWVRDIRDQCQKAGSAFFFKQWGGVRKSETGRRLDGKTYDEFPDFAEVEALETEQRLLLLREVESEYRVGAGK